MGDNITKIVLHVNNDTGKIEKAEHEDGTEAVGNFEDITLKQDTSSAQMNWRLAPEEEPSDDDGAQTKTSSQGPPSV